MRFPRYPKYKASGIEWLGDVPEEWAVSCLKHSVNEIYSGGTPDTGNPEYWAVDEQDSIPWVAISDMTRASSVERTEKQITRAGVASKRLRVLPKGTLLYSMYASLGKVAVLAKPATINQAILGIIPDSKKHTQDFLRYWLIQIERHLSLFSSSNTQDNLNAGKVRILPLLVPNIEEQKQITDFLDRETAKIDELVLEQQRLVELLKEKISSLVLSSVDSPNTRHMRLGEAASIISRPVLQQKEESYTRLGLFNRGRGLFHKDASEMDDMGESDFFWIEEGDLIISGQFAWEGAVAMAGKADTGCVVSHRYPVLRGVPGIALTEYLFGLLCTNHGDFILNENSRGAAGRNRPLNIRYLMKETIPVPSMHIQEAVASAIHSRAALLQEISNTINLLQERRAALISAAVTGQIDVRQQSKK